MRFDEHAGMEAHVKLTASEIEVGEIGPERHANRGKRESGSARQRLCGQVDASAQLYMQAGNIEPRADCDPLAHTPRNRRLRVDGLHLTLVAEKAALAIGGPVGGKTGTAQKPRCRTRPGFRDPGDSKPPGRRSCDSSDDRCARSHRQ